MLLITVDLSLLWPRRFASLLGTWELHSRVRCFIVIWANQIVNFELKLRSLISKFDSKLRDSIRSCEVGGMASTEVDDSDELQSGCQHLNINSTTHHHLTCISETFKANQFSTGRTYYLYYKSPLVQTVLCTLSLLTLLTIHNLQAGLENSKCNVDQPRSVKSFYFRRI